MEQNKNLSERQKELRKLRNQRYYQNKKQQVEATVEVSEAGLTKCTQCEVLQSEDQYRPVGEQSHIGIPSKDPHVCSNCHWYNKTYGAEVWKERRAKRKAAERAKAYRDSVLLKA